MGGYELASSFRAGLAFLPAFCSFLFSIDNMPFEQLAAATFGLSVQEKEVLDQCDKTHKRNWITKEHS
jgi:hypothetical protein